MVQDVFIIGATGRVGCALVDQIIKKGDLDPNIHSNPTRIVGLASSSHVVHSSNGLNEQQAHKFLNKEVSGGKNYSDLAEILELVNGSDNVVFVDVTSLNEPMTDFHIKVISDSRHSIVTANKNPVALSGYSAFKLLTRETNRYGYRCSVMAGADSVPFLRDLRDLNDNLHSFEGCLSGSLGYITSELEKGRKFSEIVREANSKGYTETHPRDDLGGLDVARKLIVLARAAGFPIGIEDVKIEPFIPQEYLSIGDVNAFLDDMKEIDTAFKARMENAEKKNCTLRYVAEMEAKDSVMKVSLKDVPKQSLLGKLRGTMNMVIVSTEIYKEGCPIGPVPGAGLEVTARNIRRDLLYLLQERKSVF
ncbi:hypothetical protein HYW20_03690 [Candidatus Woesearchaeota archaeon]|nr:hypothetical protein [Candidatus Woesearchaeota archaeon]